MVLPLLSLNWISPLVWTKGVKIGAEAVSALPKARRWKAKIIVYFKFNPTQSIKGPCIDLLL